MRATHPALAALVAGLLGCGGASSKGPESAGSDSASGSSSAVEVAPPAGGLADLGGPLAEVTPPRPDSRLGATLSISVDAVRALIDRELPRKLEQDWQRVTRKGASPEVEARYVVRRDDIAVSIDGRKLRVELPVRYHADLRGRVRVPFVKKWLPLSGDLDWGTGKHPQRVTVAATVELDVAPDYALRLDAKALPLVHGKPPGGKACVKAGISLCVSKKGLAPEVRKRIDGVVKPRLDRALSALKKQLRAAIDTRRQVRALWATAGCPWSLTAGVPVCDGESAAKHDLWLRFEPKRVGVGTPRLVSAPRDGKGKGKSKAKGKQRVELDLSVNGRATVVAGAWPALHVSPLPAPQRGAKGGFDVAVHAEMPYSAIAAAATAELLQRPFPVGRMGELRVTRVAVDGRRGPDEQPRLLLELHVDGAAKGILYLWGRPSYDARAQVLRFTDLDYTVETRDRFVKGLESINHERFRQELMQRAVFDVSPRITELTTALEAALSRKLGKGLRSHGNVETLSLMEPVLSSDRALVPVRLRGELRVDAKL